MHEPLEDSECDRCDDYLAGALGPGERERFDRHLSKCVSCAEAVQEDRTLREWLISATTAEPISSDLMEKFEGAAPSEPAVLRPAAAHSRRRRLPALAGLVAAAVAIVLSSWLLIEPRSGHDRTTASVGRQNPVPTDQQAAVAPTAPAVGAQIGEPDEFITVPITSRDPKISIFWAYPTKRVTRDESGRTRPRLLNSLSLPTTGEST